MNLASFAGPPAALSACDNAVSRLFMRQVNHYFRSKVKYCLTGGRGGDNKPMLDAQELARRLRRAMDDPTPPITGAAMAAACGVTPQAVSGWRTDGRIAKRHLLTISAITRQPIDYYVRDRTDQDVKIKSRKERRKLPAMTETIIDDKNFQLLFRAWQDTDPHGRQFLNDAANTALKVYGRNRSRKTA